MRTLSGLTGILMFINVHFCKWRKSHPFRLFWKARRWRFWNFPPRLRCVAIFRMHIAYFQNNSRTNNVVLITDVIFNWTIEIFSWLPFSWETFAYCMRVVVENFCTTAKTILSYERNCNSSDCLLLNHYQNENVATRWLKLVLSLETSLVVTVSILSSFSFIGDLWFNILFLHHDYSSIRKYRSDILKFFFFIAAIVNETWRLMEWKPEVIMWDESHTI